jgi:hypothetical protein
MILKKLFLLIFVIFIFSVSGNALERKKPLPIPMEELMNSKSKSYVPVPYPKSEAEVLKDLKYYLKRHHSKNFYSTRSDGTKFKTEDINAILYEAFKSKGRVKINRIIKVKNNSIYHDYEYYHLIEFVWKEKPEISFCRYIQGDNGLFLELANIEVKDINNPLSNVPLIKSEKDMQSYFNKIILKSDETNMEKNKYEWIQLTTSEMPYFSIETNKGKYYIDGFYNIYQEQSQIKISDPKERDAYLSKNTPDNEDKYFLNEIEEKIIQLKRIHKSEEYIKRIEMIKNSEK